MRAFSSSIMAALVVVALFWGNCFSCPQMFFSQKATKSHGCCKRTQQPAPEACSTQSIHHFVKAESNTTAQPALAEVAVEVTELSAPVWREVEPAPAETDHAPPDLLALHSSFRI
jgi:hypothetical protein